MTARGIHTCCPEAPDITVTQNIIQLDGLTTVFEVDEFEGAAVAAASNVMTLSSVPYAAKEILVFLNSGHQGFGVTKDYTVIYDTVHLNFTPVAGDVIRVQYMAVSDGTTTLSDQYVPTGSRVGYTGGTAPDGWLLMDLGVEVHYGADEASNTQRALFQYLHNNLDLTTVGVAETDDYGNYYELKDIDDSYYDAATGLLVTSDMIIKL